MRVLFVSSGNSGKASILVQRQAESLQKQGLEVNFFLVKGKGLKGYLKSIKVLRKYLNSSQFDIIHAHYSLSAFVASLAGAKPMVVSLMGSDVKAGGFYKNLIRFFKQVFSWKALIVKSQDMKSSLGIEAATVIPNGVNLDYFKPASKEYCQKELNWDLNKKHFLFAANPKRREKNYQLAKVAVDLLDDTSFELHVLDNVSHEQMHVYYNASDVVLLSSLWEGSPNVIKEAMACNRPIVGTDIGDIRWLFGNEPGHFISKLNSIDFYEKVNLAFAFSENKKRTKGRDRIIDLGLDSKNIARKIAYLYQGCINSNEN